MAYKPPRDHAESIRMLKAEDDRVKNGSSTGFVVKGFLLIACIVVLVLLAAGVLFDLFGIFR